MNSKEDFFPRLDPVPGEAMLARKRFLNLQMEVTVFQEASNLLPPLDPPQPPPMDPAQPPTEIGIEQFNKYFKFARAVQKRPAILNFAPRTNEQDNAPKDLVPETQVC